jgi:hypothetical protein
MTQGAGCNDVHRLGRRRGAPRLRQQRRDVRFLERPEPDSLSEPVQRAPHLTPTDPVVLTVARGGQHQCWGGPQRGCQLDEQLQRGRVGVVQVIDHHEQRLRRGGQQAGKVQRQPPACGLRVTVRRDGPLTLGNQFGEVGRLLYRPRCGGIRTGQYADHPRPGTQRTRRRAPCPHHAEPIGSLRGLFRQPALADPRFPGDHQ